MKKLCITLFTLILICSSAFAYELNSKDKKKIAAVWVALEKIYLKDKQRFNTISDKIDAILPQLSSWTRSYALISEIDMIIEDIKNNDNSSDVYRLKNVVDGDTVVLYNVASNLEISYRLIWIDAPETSALRFWEIEEYGKESTQYLTSLLEDSDLYLEYDSSQSKIDDFGRHLVYIHANNKNVNKEMIRNGYAKEYTYNTAYKYQKSFRSAEKEAQKSNIGIWGLEETPQDNIVEEIIPEDTSCNIKWNINSKGVKIYHYPGCQSYTRTKISPEKGEKYFCSTQEAESAWWRVAGNCH